MSGLTSLVYSCRPGKRSLTINGYDFLSRRAAGRLRSALWLRFKTTPATPTATATVLDGKTMGTFWRVSVIGVDEAKAQALRAKVQAQLDADDRLLSTWKNDSALMRFNHAATTEPWPVSEAMADIVTLSLRIGAKTHGAMDITVGPLVNLWGFGPDKQPVTTPDAEAIAAAKARTGLQHLQVINQSGRQFLQKDIPDLFVDLSTVGKAMPPTTSRG